MWTVNFGPIDGSDGRCGATSGPTGADLGYRVAAPGVARTRPGRSSPRSSRMSRNDSAGSDRAGQQPGHGPSAPVRPRRSVRAAASGSPRRVAIADRRRTGIPVCRRDAGPSGVRTGRRSVRACGRGGDRQWRPRNSGPFGAVSWFGGGGGTLFTCSFSAHSAGRSTGARPGGRRRVVGPRSRRCPCRRGPPRRGDVRVDRSGGVDERRIRPEWIPSPTDGSPAPAGLCRPTFSAVADESDRVKHMFPRCPSRCRCRRGRPGPGDRRGIRATALAA